VTVRVRAIWPWLTLALVLLGVATSFSTFRVSKNTFRYLFVVDITQSMNVTDMELNGAPATRFEFAKSAVEFALGNLPCGSEAGLGIFAAHRTFVMFTPVEICEHYLALSEMLRKIDWRMAWTARSEVAKGLYSALEGTLQIPNETRLVFLTDGHEAPPLNKDIRPPMRTEAGEVTGLIVGVGGAVPSQIPHLDDNDNIVGYWSHDEVMQIDIHSLGRAASAQGESMVGINMSDVARRIMLGQEHLSSLRENHLQGLAAGAKLDYARVDSPSGFVEDLRNEKYARRTPVLSDVSWIPAGLALIALIYVFVFVPWRRGAV
jgi:mxaL protein